MFAATAEAFIALVRASNIALLFIRARYYLSYGWTSLHHRLPPMTLLNSLLASKLAPVQCQGPIVCDAIRASPLRHKAGFRTASYDWEFEKKAMNFLSAPGFVSLGYSML